MVLRTIALSLVLVCGIARAQEEVPLRHTLNMVGEELDGSARLQEASMFLYYVGGILAGIGFDRKDDDLKLIGGSLVIGGMITTHLSIGRKRTAARLLKEL